MNIVAAENCFRRGLAALSEGRAREAAQLFHAAMQIEREHGAPRPQMRYLSYYGLSLAYFGRAGREAIRACETAARQDFFNPDLHLNLGRVYLLAGLRVKAIQSFERGLKLAPQHAVLRAELAKVDRRGPVVFARLARSHPLNRWAGRLRAYLPRRKELEKLPERRTV